MNLKKDISSILISEDFIHQKLPSIFMDSIMVDRDFNIIGVSQNVLDFMEYTIEEVKNKNINCFSVKEDLQSELKNCLTGGYFEKKKKFLRSKSNKNVYVNISGFYLGLISDMNDLIVLKVSNLNEVELVYKQLQQKQIELDSFIYRASHDLRGPLATIKGLLNLVKIAKDDSELENLLPLLNLHANMLDERLLNFVYLAQAGQPLEETENKVDFKNLETSCRKTIEQNAFVDFLEFIYTAPNKNITGINEELLASLLNNLMLHILSLPFLKAHCRLSIDLSQRENFLEIVVESHGFELKESVYNAIFEDEFIYRNITKYPKLINFYSAQKIALKLRASLRLNYVSAEKQKITLQIPLLDELDS
jgi:hypothetical protein